MPARFASLTSRLVLTAVALVAVVSLLIGAVTTIAMRSSLLDRLDRDVAELAERPPALLAPDSSEFPDVPDFRRAAPGTLEAIVGDTGSVAGAEQDDDETLSSAAMDVLATVPADGEVHSVDIPGYGSYRVIADDDRLVTAADGDPVTYVSGLPTSDVDDTITNLVGWEVLLTALGILAAVGIGSFVVRRQLRPLTEVASTARAVAALPLDSGEIEIAERVPAHLTDESTEVGRVGSALNTMLAHVESSLDARHRSEQQVRQFVADASHELRTPLTTIAGYTELARRRGDRATTETALAKVEEESARMTALVEDLLLLARLDAGRPLQRTRVDLTRLAFESVDDARVVDPDRDWRVRLPGEGPPVEIEGDAARLHQVLTNLLTNARKYTPARTTVTVRVHHDGFEVVDDGPGFSPELAAVAFERFTRGDAARHRQGGVGLGLALVQAIVVAHGGSVTLQSVPGDTRIRVFLR